MEGSWAVRFHKDWFWDQSYLIYQLFGIGHEQSTDNIREGFNCYVLFSLSGQVDGYFVKQYTGLDVSLVWPIMALLMFLRKGSQERKTNKQRKRPNLYILYWSDAFKEHNKSLARFSQRLISSDILIVTKSHAKWKSFCPSPASECLFCICHCQSS